MAVRRDFPDSAVMWVWQELFTSVPLPRPLMVQRFTGLLARKCPPSKIPDGWLLPRPCNQKKSRNSSVTRCEIADLLNIYGLEQIHGKITGRADGGAGHWHTSSASGRRCRTSRPWLCWNRKRVLYRALVEKAGVSPDLLKRKTSGGVWIAFRASPATTTTGQGLYVTQRLNKLLVAAQDEAKKLKDDYVSVEHLVLAMFSEPATTDIGKIFKTFDFRREKFLKALTEVRGNQRVTSANPEATYESLEKYGRDLTRLAAQNKLDPVIGRDAEIRRCIQVLSRRTKNNPVLIGEPGVGKTAIVEGLATAHRLRRRARQPQREAYRGARSRGADRGSEISGRIRRAAEGGAAGGHQGTGADHSSS